jgi:hypothetical protein
LHQKGETPIISEMAICNVCDSEKGGLTREHIIGDALGNKVIKGPNHVWSEKADKFFETSDFVIRDT